MKKLLSILTAVTIAGSATSSLVSCKIITNTFDIEFANEKEILDDIKYTFDKEKKEYIKKETKPEGQETVGTKAELNSALSFGYGWNVINEIANTAFFSAKHSVLNNKNQQTWNYIYKSDVDGQSTDGQFRTAYSKDIDNYYTIREEKQLGFSSILGIYDYSVWKEGQEKNQTFDDQTGGTLPTIDESQRKLVDQMYNSSKNQGITNFKLNNNLSVLNGDVYLAEEESNPQDQQTTKETSAIKTYKTSSEASKYISGDINFNAKTAAADINTKEGYSDYTVGANYGYDPFSQVLIVDAKKAKDELPQNITIKQIKSDDKFTEHKKGKILNAESKTPTPNSDEEGIVFEYKTKDDKPKAAISSSNVYGYSLVSMDALDLEITYNDDIEIKGKPSKTSNYYTIKMTIEGLQAVFSPVVALTNVYDKDGKKDETKSGIPYVGWKFMGYQFNDTNVSGYNNDGDILTSKDLPNKQTKTLQNKKFKDFAITKFEIAKKTA